VFDAPHVLFCIPAGDEIGRWKAAFTMAGPEFASHQVCVEVLKFAFDLTQWTCKANAANPIDRLRFFQTIHRGVLLPNSKLMPPGKSTYEVLQAAYRGGVPFLPLAAGVFQLGWGHRSRKIDRSTTDRDTAMAVHWSRNKFWTASVLAKAGLPTPAHHLVQTLSAALEAAEKIGYPLVVKPVDLERGEGVFVDVSSEQLVQAYTKAHHLSPSKQVLVEQQVPGVCHRLFVCAGRLLYAVRRLPMGVYADGTSAISELVNTACQQQEMLPPWKRSGLKQLDELALSMLIRQGWGASSVPPAGKFVALRRIETSALGGVDEEVTHTLHPENLQIALAAANIFGLEVAGIDIMSPDITQPWFANGAVINEVNFAPLLGGGEISRRYLGEYLDRLVSNQGRIDVVVFVGGAAAWKAAEAHWQSKRQAGVAAFLTSAFETLDAQGQTLRLAQQGLNARLRALILRREVQALVVVVQTLELLTLVPVLDRVDALHVVDDEVVVGAQTLTRASAPQVAALVEFCKKWAGQL
jgi:D-alanine-D-alanine ligase-like ATP-grasp enzyme